MFDRIVLCLLLAGITAGPYANANAESDFVQFHGSGSSAVSRCFWHILEKMSWQSKIPTRATYRSTGSGTGITEFIGNVTHSHNDFGSADYPMSSEDYNRLRNAGEEVVHLPVLMAAYNTFHSLPLEPLVEGEAPPSLNLTSCLIARIFKGEITNWQDPEIVKFNPNMRLATQLDFYGRPAEDQSYPIKVAVRSDGSGTTKIFTTYLHKVCPEHWGEELVADLPEWPMANSINFIPASGTGNMIPAITDNPGTIGYSTSGSALGTPGLAETALLMESSSLKTDFFLTSENSLSKDGVAVALDGAEFPSSGDADWSAVDVINQVEGYIYAWPMVSVTYAFVKKDLTKVFPNDPRSQTYLKAFFRGLYDPDYVKSCEEDYKFLSVKGDWREAALQSVDSLVVSPGAPEWTVEHEVFGDGLGLGDYVLSSRRNLGTLLQQEQLRFRADQAEAALESAMKEIELVRTESLAMSEEIELVIMQMDAASEALSPKDERRLNASLVMSIMSLVIWFFTAMYMFSQSRRIAQMESRTKVVAAASGKRGER